MIDFTARTERLLAEARDPSVAVIVLDVVLGYGANADPAGELAPAVREARAETWEEAALLAGQSATAIRHMRQAFVASPVMGELAVVRAEALEQFAKGLHERATAARAGQLGQAPLA